MAWSTPSEAHASLHALMEQAETAVVERRHAAAADLYGLAAERSTSVFAPDSLLTATMQLRRANSLTARSVQPEVTDAESTAMNEQAWALVHASTAVLLRRHAAGTLLPGVCRLEEVEFEREALEEARLTAGTPPSAAYDIGATCVGVDTFMDAARQTLYRLHPTLYGLLLPDLPAEEKAAAQQVVLQSLDIIAASRDVHAPIAGEGYLVKAITGLLASTVLDSSFRNALNNKWTSPHVIAGLRAHGSLHPDEAAVLAMLTSRDAAGRARLGLHLCGLTSCTKREVIQGQFAVCSACKSIAYCCKEHGAQHWKEHKQECKELVQEMAMLPSSTKTKPPPSSTKTKR